MAARPQWKLPGPLNGKLFAAGAFIALLWAGWLAWTAWTVQTPAPATRDRPGATEVWIWQDTDLNQVEIRLPRAHMVLTRTAQDWFLVEPESGPADADAVTEWVTRLSAWIRQSGEPVRPPSKEEANQPPGWLRLVTATGATYAWSLIGPDPTTRELWARRDGGRDWVRLPPWPITSVDVLVTSLRSRRLVAEPLDGACQFGWQSPEGALVVEQQENLGDSPWMITQPAPAPASAPAVAELLARLSRWNIAAREAEQLWGKSALAAYGLTPPHSRLWIHFHDRRQPLELQFGHPDTEGPWYVKSNRDTRVVHVEAADVVSLREALDRLTDRRLLPGFADIRVIEVLQAHRRLVFRRQPDAWVVQRFPWPGGSESAGEIVAWDAGDWFAPGLAALSYIDTVTVGHPAYPDYRNAGPHLKIDARDAAGKVVEAFTLLRSETRPRTLFLERNADGRVFLVPLEPFLPLDLQE